MQFISPRCALGLIGCPQLKHSFLRAKFTFAQFEHTQSSACCRRRSTPTYHPNSATETTMNTHHLPIRWQTLTSTGDLTRTTPSLLRRFRLHHEMKHKLRTTSIQAYTFTFTTQRTHWMQHRSRKHLHERRSSFHCKELYTSASSRIPHKRTQPAYREMRTLCMRQNATTTITSPPFVH